MTAAISQNQILQSGIQKAQSAQLSIFYDQGEVGSSHLLEPGLIYQLGTQQNTLENEKSEHKNNPIVHILISGRLVAPKHLQVWHDGQNWVVTRYGTTPVWMNDLEMDVLIGVSVDNECVLRIPGVTITLRTIAAHSLINVDDGKSWRAEQDRLHLTILDEYRKRAGSDASERLKTNEQLRSDPQFIGVFGSVAQSTVDELPPKVVDEAFLWAIRKHLLAKVAGGSRSNIALRLVPPQFEAQQLIFISDRIAQEINLKLTRATVDEDIETIRRDLPAIIVRWTGTTPIGDRREIAKAFFCSNIWDLIFNLGPLTDLMQLSVVTEIMVARYDKIFLERSGVLEPYGYTFSSPAQLEVLAQRIANQSGREINESNAMVDFRLADGSRVNIIGYPLSLAGHCITIRKHGGELAWTLKNLVKIGSMSEAMALFLQASVVARKNIIISGGTGSGKTTLLNALSSFIQRNQRIVTIEDTAELILDHDHVVPLQSRPANAEGNKEVTIRMLVKNALRMRPDRIIVGECRDGAAVDMLQALNTGHAGSMTTAHANTPAEMLLRLEVMVLQGEPNLPVRAIRQQIGTALDIIVQVARVNGARRVTEISEVIGFDTRSGELIVEPIFVYQFGSGENGKARHMFTGLIPTFAEEIYTCRPAVETENGIRRVGIDEIFS